MGKLILCCGSRTKRPYLFKTTGYRIYSIEELCYYISRHIYFIDMEMFSDSLIDWIGTELGLSDRSEKLKLLKEHQADLKTMLAAALCSSDYFTEQEIKKLLITVDEINQMTPVKRSCLRARSYLENRQYAEAAGEYERVLNSEYANNMTPEDYGDILHNLAVTKLHTKGMKEASETFRQAYERNRREETLRQYLYTLKLSNKEDQFMDKLEEYQVKDRLREEITLFMDRMLDKAEECERMTEIRQLQKWRTEGRVSELRNKSMQLLEGWISSIRQI